MKYVRQDIDRPDIASRTDEIIADCRNLGVGRAGCLYSNDESIVRECSEATIGSKYRKVTSFYPNNGSHCLTRTLIGRKANFLVPYARAYFFGLADLRAEVNSLPRNMPQPL